MTVSAGMDEFDGVSVRFAAIAIAAGGLVLAHYRADVATRHKSDDSPVTAADEASEEAILAALAEAFPGIPVVSEEAASCGKCPLPGDDFILVDPLDGTREFLAGNGEFSINIALIRSGKPVAGAIFAPASGGLWFAGAHAFTCMARGGDGMPPAGQWQAIHTRKPVREAIIALVSRSHLDAKAVALLDGLGVSDRRASGSSLKFALIAQGEGDIYPRFGPTMEWDVAAGDAILRAAGGIVYDGSGAPMTYGHASRQYRLDAFVAWADASAPLDLAGGQLAGGQPAKGQPTEGKGGDIDWS